MTALVVLALVTIELARPAADQERPAPVVEIAAGALLFQGDSMVVEGRRAIRIAAAG